MMQPGSNIILACVHAHWSTLHAQGGLTGEPCWHALLALHAFSVGSTGQEFVWQESVCRFHQAGVSLLLAPLTVHFQPWLACSLSYSLLPDLNYS
eukprot:1161188-Pelagomonas_calceolata.AAC.5